ncbi:SAM-dependent methyltransferase, partial [Streptomyces caniferus]
YSFSPPRDMRALARAAGLADARHVPGGVLAERYFADRTDGLRPSSGEDFLLATI